MTVIRCSVDRIVYSLAELRLPIAWSATILRVPDRPSEDLTSCREDLPAARSATVRFFHS
jgi:hypothetical protein